MDLSSIMPGMGGPSIGGMPTPSPTPPGFCGPGAGGLPGMNGSGSSPLPIPSMTGAASGATSGLQPSSPMGGSFCG